MKTRIARIADNVFEDALASRIATAIVKEREKRTPGNAGVDGLQKEVNKTNRRKKVDKHGDSVYEDSSIGLHTLEHSMTEAEAEAYLRDHPDTEYTRADLIKSEMK
jgi:hypothetical protein